MSLGTYPDTSLASARAKRDEARKLLAAGADSGSIKKNRRALRLFFVVRNTLARQPKPRSNTHRTDVSDLAAYRQLFANTSIDDIDGLRL